MEVTLGEGDLFSYTQEVQDPQEVQDGQATEKGRWLLKVTLANSASLTAQEKHFCIHFSLHDHNPKLQRKEGTDPVERGGG